MPFLKEKESMTSFGGEGGCLQYEVFFCIYILLRRVLVYVFCISGTSVSNFRNKYKSIISPWLNRQDEHFLSLLFFYDASFGRNRVGRTDVWPLYER
jgi:hypothetical protein